MLLNAPLLDPNPYCEALPTQLRYWDSTSLRAFQECPRKYQLSIVEGWRPQGKSYDLAFGSMYHECVELFDTLMVRGVSKETATDKAVALALSLSWLKEPEGRTETTSAAGRPWAGSYVAGWRCNNWKPGKRSVYKCPAAKSWWGGHQGDGQCPKCRHSVTNRWVWAPEHKTKNRYTLFAAVLEYCDQAKEAGGVQPLVFPDGQVALELSFQLPLGFQSPDGGPGYKCQSCDKFASGIPDQPCICGGQWQWQTARNDPYILCGHLDGMVTLSGETCVRERKTTGSNVNASFWDRYAPDTQIDNYELAAQLLYRDTLHPQHVMIEVMQVDANAPKLHRGLVTRTAGVREEGLRDLGYWIKQAEACATADYYPKNNASCHTYGRGCQFCRICKEEPGENRERILEAYYYRDRWNPAKSR